MRNWGAVVTGLFFMACIPIVQAADGKISLDNLDPVRTSQVAFKSVNDTIDAKSARVVLPTLYISDAAKLRDYKSSLTGMNRIATLWSDVIPNNQLPVVLFTEDDGPWVDQKQTELTGSWLRDSELQSQRLKKYGCNIGGMYLPGVLFFCVKYDPRESTVSYGDLHVFAHEYTHFMEMNVKNWTGSASGNAIGKRNSCWIEEGFATFYGMAVGASPEDQSGSKRRKFLSDLLFNYDNNRKQPQGTLKAELERGNANTVKSLMAMLENTPWPCDETQNAYALGSLAAEALVASFGQEQMVKFYLSSASTGDWKKSFQNVFGLSVDTFYEKLTPYIASQFTESNFALPTPVATSTPKPSVTASASPSPSAEPVVSISRTPAPKKITITCVKGKTTKKVTALNPKCPAGYKKK